MKICSVDAEFIQKDGLMDRHRRTEGDIDMTQLRVAFLNFADATKDLIKINFLGEVNLCSWASGARGFKRSSFVHLQG
jgi:hypothetical protein